MKSEDELFAFFMNITLEEWFTLQTIRKFNRFMNEPIGRLFSQLTKRYIGIVTHQLAHLPIERYYYVVYVLAHADGALTQKALGDQLGVDKASMVRIVDYLGKHNYLTRTVNPNDRREQLLTLTPAGKKAAGEIGKAFKLADDFCLDGLAPACRENFIGSLETVVGRLCDVEADQVLLNYKRIKQTK